MIIGAPIDSVGAASAGDAPFGCELMPATLRAAGVVTAVGAPDEGDMDVRIVGRDVDSETGMFGWPSVTEVTTTIRARIAGLLTGGKVPVVIGGCCALVPAAIAGVRDALGPVGLAYVDGHLDLYDALTSPTREAADMPIAVIAGLGPAAWCEHVGAPLVDPERIVLLGAADRDEAASLRSRMPEDLGIPVELSPAVVRSIGPEHVGQGALDQVGDKYWVHLDVDVFDQREFPATNYPNSVGLGLDEAAALLRPLTGSSGMIGFSVGCYNPDIDPDGDCARSLVSLLGKVLGQP
ncbi:MAG: Arginase/agmatinase/formiminoglutamase [Actinomycetia bacterium]|nr:Arginase/agmatinase/formiminoglutamase [Actinomycetes bacterium]